MLRLTPKYLDPYIALNGWCLSRHFEMMDELLWRCLQVIAQVEPDYLQRSTLGPAIKQACGTASGRRWFIRGPNKNVMGVMIDALRVWVQYGDWAAFLNTLRWLCLYRDTLREWVEEYEANEKRIQDHIDHWMKLYFRVREEITKSYFPLVWSIASKYGFNEESKADMFQIGITGLIHATERYNNSGPMTFHKFAGQWIRQRILMAISRQMPIIRVSHSILEAESRINREERRKGKGDSSIWAQKIKSIAASKDVILVEDTDINDGVEEPESVIDISALPSQLRKVLIIKHEILDKATCPHLPSDLEQEAERQLKAINKRSCKG